MGVMKARRRLLMMQSKPANMIDNSDIVPDYAISANGTVSSNSAAAYVDYIEVEERFYTISVYNPIEPWNYRLHGYDAQKQWVKQINVTNVPQSSDYSLRFKPDEGIRYIRLSMYRTAQNVTMIPT